MLHGAELNIDPDGGVDWDEEFLEGFDVLVASVHSHFTQSRDAMTRRLIRAIEHPCVNVIGHPTGRKIGRRDPIDFDEEAVFEAAARTGTAMEIDSHPDRLDPARGRLRSSVEVFNTPAQPACRNAHRARDRQRPVAGSVARRRPRHLGTEL